MLKPILSLKSFAKMNKGKLREISFQKHVAYFNMK